MDGFDNAVGSHEARNESDRKAKGFGGELGDAVISEGKAAIAKIAADYSHEFAAVTENGLRVLRLRVARQPLTALGVAAVAGALVGVALSRR